ncbi:hypothetical protein ANN_16463 [Periplaneta americana]|uniref:G-protein coupled receptors family 2 profile 1 domain-containing protein n=1 Tax=Periplaneta americana TaxID=6978 RepID=A0ABQ8SJ15_PERAM|nr:hypothetical protein ANN_16463 [Periplaneta americana]
MAGLCEGGNEPPGSLKARLFCPGTFDGWSCWPETRAGSSAHAPCPDFVTGFDPNRYDGWINFENETQDRQEWRNAICEREGKDSGFSYDFLDGAKTTFRGMVLRDQPGEYCRRNGRTYYEHDVLEEMVNERRFRGRRRYQMLDDINIGSYEETKKKAENRKDWRMLGLQ